MKKKLFLILLFMFLIIPFRVDAVTIAYTDTPRGGGCNQYGEDCDEWYDPIYSVNSYKYRMYCLDEMMKGPGTSGKSYTHISKYDIKGVGPACAFIAKGVPTNYWDYDKYSTSGNTSTMIKYDYIMKRYIQDNSTSTTKCSRYYYVSGNCNSKNQAVADDGSNIEVSLSSFNNSDSKYSVATVTVKPTGSVSSWSVKVTDNNDKIITGTVITNDSGKSISNGIDKIKDKKLYIKIPKTSVTEKETVKVTVSSSYSLTCTYKMPVLRMYYYTPYVTNGALNTTGKKYFNVDTGRRKSTVTSSDYQSIGVFAHEEVTTNPKSYTKSDTAKRSLDSTLGNIKITKQDTKTKAGLTGVVFELYSGAGCSKKYNDTTYTTKNGIYEISNLPAGTYSLKEVSTISGYRVKTEKEACTDGIVVTAGGTANVSITNDPLGGIEIYKYSYGFNSALSGVVFELYSNDSCSTLIKTSTTGNDGKVKFDNLEADTYYLKEITPSGYAVNSDYVCRPVVVEMGETNHLSIVNKKYYTLAINKKDAITNEPLDGVKFALYKYTNDRCTDNAIATNETQNGVAVFNNLLYGSYCYKEIEVPDGYILDNTPHGPIIINNNVELTIENAAMSMEIEKISLKDKQSSLPGSKIVFAYLSNAKDDNKDKITYSYVITEDKSSVVSIIPGVYAIYEEDAPAGFNLLQESFLIKVDDEGKITKYTGDEYNDLLEYPVVEDSEFFELENNKLTIVNEPIYVRISKQDITSFKEVEGATIIIYDENGKEIEKFISDGKVSNKFYLEPGNYTLVEKVPPKGYKKIETKINFAIGSYGFIALEDEENKMYTTDGNNTIILYNEIEIFEVPITGLSKNLVLITLGVALVGGGVYLIYRKKKAY